MFKLVRRDTRWRTCKFDILGDLEVKEPVEFEVEIRTATVEEGKEQLAGIQKGEITDKEFLERWVVTWRKLLTEGGDPLPYNEATLIEFMSYPEPLKALVNLVLEDVTRHDLLKRKN